MAAHALLSASGSKRWLSCPPSARLEQQFPESRSGYAEEGSFAHALAEHKLKCYITVISKSKREAEYAELKKDKYYSEDLESYVDIYVDFVKERINAAYAKTKDAVIMLEQRLDFSEWVPEGFGTGDVVIVADGYVEVIDLKFGKGVAVSAEGNTQMQLYALGAYSILSMLYDIDTVRMSICQPRLDDISGQEMSVKELLAWADGVVKPTAAKAIKGEGEFAAGDHCRFCRAKATCRARAEANLELAKYDFQDTFLLSDDEIADILSKAEKLQAWAADVQAYALDQAANHGKKWPGWKLVEGRSNRKYTDEKQVMDILKGAGYEEDKYAPRELIGITALEKEITKKKFGELLSNHVIKPTGKPVLVLETDKRPEISSVQSAVNDFSEAV
jgi:hypothetical protein